MKFIHCICSPAALCSCGPHKYISPAKVEASKGRYLFLLGLCSLEGGSCSLSQISPESADKGWQMTRWWHSIPCSFFCRWELLCQQLWAVSLVWELKLESRQGKHQFTTGMGSARSCGCRNLNVRLQVSVSTAFLWSYQWSFARSQSPLQPCIITEKLCSTDNGGQHQSSTQELSWSNNNHTCGCMLYLCWEWWSQQAVQRWWMCPASHQLQQRGCVCAAHVDRECWHTGQSDPLEQVSAGQQQAVLSWPTAGSLLGKHTGLNAEASHHVPAFLLDRSAWPSPLCQRQQSHKRTVLSNLKTPENKST